MELLKGDMNTFKLLGKHGFYHHNLQFAVWNAVEKSKIERLQIHPRWSTENKQD